jgi:hypothetical protein
MTKDVRQGGRGKRGGGGGVGKKGKAGRIWREMTEGERGLREHVTTNAESKCRGQAVPSARVHGPFRVDGRRREGGRAGGWGWGGVGWHSSVEVEEAGESRKGGRRK